jgi:Uma2 family endonuclease
MPAGTMKLTARQFRALRPDPPGTRLELARGEVAVSPSPGLDHQRAVYRLAGILGDYVEANGLGTVNIDVDVLLGRHEVRRPDVFFVNAARRHILGRRVVKGAPDLCVEITSPGPRNRRIDRREKLDVYRQAGVAFYWIVDLAGRSIEAYALKDHEYVLSGTGKETDIVRLPPFDDLPVPLEKLWHPTQTP